MAVIISEKPTNVVNKIIYGGASCLNPKAGSSPIPAIKKVCFDRDIVKRKLQEFASLLDQFKNVDFRSKREIDDGKVNTFSDSAAEWLIDRMTDDLFKTLKLDKFEWEFEAALKIDTIYRERAKGNPRDLNADTIILKKPVDEFLKNIQKSKETDINARDKTNTYNHSIREKIVQPNGTIREPKTIYDIDAENFKNQEMFKINYKNIANNLAKKVEEPVEKFFKTTHKPVVKNKKKVRRK